MIFYLGTHRPHWLGVLDVPLFVSRRVLHERRSFPQARASWVLDSGGFTELSMHGRWSITTDEYAAEVDVYAREIGSLAWVAPMDWMCEPSIIDETGLDVEEHQVRTIINFLDLRERLGSLVVPVLQGWTLDDYERCYAAYESVGVTLTDEPIVGVGSVCRRGQDAEISRIIRRLAAHGLNLHGFGVRGDALRSLSSVLTSADSMAWSFAGRRRPIHGHPHKTCANCIDYAVAWRSQLLERCQQLELEVA